jgi:hypothetical protein
MDWKKFLLKLLRNLLIFTAASTIIMGGIGYLLAGKEGLVNSLILGFVFGLVGSLMFSGIQVSADFWSGYAGRYGEWYIKKETEGDKDQKRSDEKKHA